MDWFATVKKYTEFLSYEQIGIITMAVYDYMETGEISSLPDSVYATFMCIIRDIDEAKRVKQEKSEKARKSVQARWEKAKNQHSETVRNTEQAERNTDDCACNTNVPERNTNDSNRNTNTIERNTIVVERNTKLPSRNTNPENRNTNQAKRNTKTQKRNTTSKKENPKNSFNSNIYSNIQSNNIESQNINNCLFVCLQDRGMGEGENLPVVPQTNKQDGLVSKPVQEPTPLVYQALPVHPYSFEVDPDDPSVENVKRATKLLNDYGLKANQVNLDILIADSKGGKNWEAVEKALQTANKYDKRGGLTIQFYRWHLEHQGYGQAKKQPEKRDYGNLQSGWGFTEADIG